MDEFNLSSSAINSINRNAFNNISQVPQFNFVGTSNYLNSLSNPATQSVLFQGAGNAASNAADAGSKAAEGTSWFGNNGIIGGVGTAINGIANLWGAYNSFTQGKKQLDLMKEQNELMRAQYNEETKRYNKREAERDAANADFRNTANSVYQQFAHNYETPQKRESVVERN